MIRHLYFHIPFCKRKCSYCDFTSYENQGETQKKYMDKLLEELDSKKGLFSHGKVETIFIGGGTPTVLPLVLFEKLLAKIDDLVSFEESYEFTVECNPESLDEEKLELFKRYGVNRLSMGVQSLSDETLRKLGRVHTRAEAVEKFNLARRLGFQNINLDLMYGVYGESRETWEETLKEVVALNPEHISTYQLKIEEGTVLEKLLDQGVIEEFPDDEAEKLYDFNHKVLKENGYMNYEISNYAKEGFESKHNLAYWNYSDYLGMGFGAASSYGGKRYTIAGKLETYLNIEDFAGDGVYDVEELSQEERYSEFIFMNLRKVGGFEKNKFAERFGVEIEDVFSNELETLKEKRLIIEEDGFLKLSEKGRILGNMVFEEFII